MTRHRGAAWGEKKGGAQGRRRITIAAGGKKKNEHLKKGGVERMTRGALGPWFHTKRVGQVREKILTAFIWVLEKGGLLGEERGDSS